MKRLLIPFLLVFLIGPVAVANDEVDDYKDLAETHAGEGNNDSALFYWQKVLEYAVRRDSVEALMHIANLRMLTGEYAKAREALSFVLVDNAEHRDRIKATGLLGNVSWYEGDYPGALDAYLEALSISEKIQDTLYISKFTGNIGLIYVNQNKPEEALEYYYRALAIAEELGDQTTMATWYGNIGIAYDIQGKFDESIAAYQKALRIDSTLGNKYGILRHLGNIGLVYNNMADSSSGEEAERKYAIALRYYSKALAIARETGDKRSIAINLGNIGDVHQSLDDFESAARYYEEGLTLTEEAGALYPLKYQLNGLSNLYRKMAEAGKAPNSNWKKSLDYYKRYRGAVDSLFNTEKSKEIGKLEATYEFEKAEAEKTRVLEEARQKKAAATQRRNNLQYSGILIVLVVLGAGLLFLGKLSISVRLAEGLVFFTFLLFFEFLLVLLDPTIEQYSGGEPAFKLLFNAVLAGMIFPLHNFFENKLKSRLENH